MIYSASLSESDDFVLFDSLDGNGAYSQMFYAIFQVKFTTLDGNLAIETHNSAPSRMSRVVIS